MQNLVNSEPTLLLHHGRFLDGALRGQRVTHKELLAVLRWSGHGSLDRAAAVVLETDGSFSVLCDSEPKEVPTAAGGASNLPPA